MDQPPCGDACQRGVDLSTLQQQPQPQPPAGVQQQQQPPATYCAQQPQPEPQPPVLDDRSRQPLPCNSCTAQQPTDGAQQQQPPVSCDCSQPPVYAAQPAPVAGAYAAAGPAPAYPGPTQPAYYAAAPAAPVYAGAPGGPAPAVMYAPATVTVAPACGVDPTAVVTPSSQQFPYREVQVKVICAHCNKEVSTEIHYKVGMMTWLAAGGICLSALFLGCTILCVCVPCCVPSLKDVEHQCPNCHKTLGVYQRMS
eukprot:m51a1_g2849 putative lipopolysaccharide-induced tumor necrosis factor-alpha factor homolog (253) ;mRNA; f:295242-296274